MFIKLLFSLVISHAGYYGADPEVLEGEAFRERLYQATALKHIQSPEDVDQFVESCPEILVENEKCFGHQGLSYKDARRYLFGYLHLSDDQTSIRDVYALRDFTQEDFQDSDGPGQFQIPNHEILNTEHTWPQSRFLKGPVQQIQKSDLHHLFPTANRLNSYRGNFPFGETEGELVLFNTKLGSFESECRRGPLLMSLELEGADIPSLVFQPPAEHRGNVARALFYFATRYQMNIDAAEEFYLRKWHGDDPVDEAEELRNSRIFEIQGNRNPFIDHPDWVLKIENF